MESSSPPPPPPRILRTKWHVLAVIKESPVRKRKRDDDDDDVLVIVLKHVKTAYGPLFRTPDDSDYDSDSDEVYDINRPLLDTTKEAALLCQKEIQVSFSDMKRQLKLGKRGKKHEYQDLILKALEEMKNPIPEESGVREMIVEAIFKEVGKRACVFYRGISVVGLGLLAVHYKKHLNGPASCESIQQIMSKKVRLRVDEKRDECAICFKPFVVDADADADAAAVYVQHNNNLARLPCGHPYHKECIRPWLQHKNHTCPICRYKMPTVLPLPISYTDDDA